jgi:GNAT superfamily N-acetyltransferase
VNIRRARWDDADAASAIMVDARHASVPAIPAPVHSDDQIRLWFRQVVLAQCDVWVAVHSAHIRGVMVVTTGWIEHLYIAPEWTGRGIGARLVRQAQKVAVGPLELWTFASNTGAARFYERHGFVQVDRTDGDNEEGEPDIRYRWTPPQKRRDS